ncbi:MAG: Uma2 family endonuclease, partial [Anaerolineae bacterium]|nr:Uma2 family endonuclease [Anaerolineae bacterium]
YVELHDLGVVLPAPFQMKLSRTGREPDLLFVARPHLDRLHPTHLEGPADLVVEVLSPESAARDRGEKFYEYQEAGIPEYWLIDPHRQWAEFYRLDPAGRYRLAREGSEGEYLSEILPGFRLPIEWLWKPPSLLQALRALGLTP